MVSPRIREQLAEARKARDEFIARVRAEEQYANRDPKGYRRKVILLVALAYGYIFGVLILALGLVAACIYLLIEIGTGNYVAMKILFVVGIFVIAVLRSLWVKFSPPDGLVLRRSDAPELFRQVNEIADQLKAPRPSEIRIDHRLNAAAIQIPRLGIFGWYRNTLLLGLPLLFALSKDEARAVIAHEFGHFSGAHGKFGSWAYRVERTWDQMAMQFASGQVHGAWLFSGFVKWFQPRFAATTFALRRANEYEADRAAAQIAGASAAATGLMRLTFLDPHLDAVFWDKLGEEVKSSARPPAHPFAPMPAAAMSVPDKRVIGMSLRNSFASKTDYDDTHPSLTDRLKALEEYPDSIDSATENLSRPVNESAAEALLGSKLPGIVEKLEEQFVNEASRAWATKHEEHIEACTALRDLRAKATAGPLNEEDQVDMAYLTFVIDGPEAAEPMFRSAMAAFPANTYAPFWVGVILADREDLSAEPLLRSAMSHNPKVAQSAIRALGKLYMAHGMYEKLEALRDDALESMVEQEVVEQAATEIYLSDVLYPHGLDEPALNKLRMDLSKVENLEVAYLVRRRLPNGEFRHALIAFHRKKSFEGSGEAQRLVERLAELDSLPSGTVVYSPPSREWIGHLDPLAGAKLFQHSD